MTAFTLAMAWFIGGALTAAGLLTVVRIVLGPSVLDRVVATDVLVSIVVCAVGAHAALNGGSTTLPILISLSLVGFMGSVAVARFVARDHDSPDDPATTTTTPHRTRRTATKPPSPDAPDSDKTTSPDAPYGGDPG